MPPGWLFWGTAALLLRVGLCSSVELSIDHKDAGFFLKPLFGGHQPWGPTVSESLFVVTHPKGTVRVKAAYGPFAAEEAVSPGVLQQTLGNQSLLLNNVVVDDMDVSAHLVTRSITQERPVLQVLFHASHPHDEPSARDESRKGNSKGKGTGGSSVPGGPAKADDGGYMGPLLPGIGDPGDNKAELPAGAGGRSLPLAESWCLQTHVIKGDHELTAVCRLSHARDVCVVELVLPADWWDVRNIQSADVYYSVYRMDATRQCSTTAARGPQQPLQGVPLGNNHNNIDSNAIKATEYNRNNKDTSSNPGLAGVPDKATKQAQPTQQQADSPPQQSDSTHQQQQAPQQAQTTEERIRSYIGTVTLTSGQLTYAEMKEDQHVLVYIPQKTFYPGSTFRVPVRLQAESDLTLFVVRVKARHGLKVIGAEANEPTKWRITVDLNHKRRGAMVTAFVADKENYAKTDRVQPVFEWVFQVEDEIADNDPGRIIMNLEYEMTSSNKETYGNVENRVVGRVQVQHDDTFTIVPVIKSTELINTAILTGRNQNFPMKIFSLSQTGRVTDITSQTTCHSGDTEVLKVSPSCNIVYLDGSETKGSPSVSVIAKFGRHTKFLFFKVWVPEIPLQVELSDTKLSQIKGWKAPQHQRRKARGVDFGLLTHPGLLLQEEEERREEYTTSCHLRFQQAIVEVFARFYVPDSSRDQFLVHRKALLRITGLVDDQLRIADASIATLNGNVVEGLRPGRTEIQVLSRMGRVIGVKEIRVGNDKVTIERLEVDVLTGLSMMVNANTELPGTLSTRVVRQEQLKKKYQEGLLDVAIKFSDGTEIPLRHVPPADYFLDMDTLNNHVVAFGPMLSSDRPRIIALGQGKGELLKLALELGDACQKKKSRPLAVSYVYIDVDFTSEDAEKEKLQNDGHFANNNNAYGSFDYQEVKTDKGVLHVNVQKNDDPSGVKPQPADQPYPHNNNNNNRGGAAGGHDRNSQSHPDGGNPPSGEARPNHEAQQQHVSTTRGMTALEIGMYVLLGVFCLAIVVFMVNCMVFVWRYRRKRLPHEMRDNIQNAQDWVWIGKATLERNSINTQCSQTLMPESDFNGNQSLLATAAAQQQPLMAAAPGTPTKTKATPTNPNLLHPTAGPSTSANTTATTAATAHHTNSLGSNRNSVVSTYKGSECSIRITSNPHPDANPAAAAGSSNAGASAGSSNQNVANNNNINNNINNSQPSTSGNNGAMAGVAGARPSPPTGGAEGGANLNNNPIPPPVPPHRVQHHPMTLNRAPHPQNHHNQNLMHHHSYPNANGYPNPREFEWDYEAMGMTYEQLMEYFDNLKESTA